MKFNYAGIEVKDLDKSIEFYRDVVEMKFLGRSEIEATSGEVAALKTKESEHVFEMNWYTDSAYREGGECWTTSRSSAGRRTGGRPTAPSGVTLAKPIAVRPKYVVGFVKDPNGIWLELYEARKVGHGLRAG